MFRKAVVCAVFASFLATGCHVTRVAKPGVAARPYEFKDRQWFTLGGFVPLSNKAGDECRSGFKSVTSRLSAGDVLLAVGLGVVGALAGEAICVGCGSFVSPVMPLLISSRTVRYSCIESSSAGLDFDTVAVEAFKRLAESSPAPPAEALAEPASP